jgi:aminoglycoside 3-N-acetyltransferase I
LTAYQLDKFEQDRCEIYIYNIAALEQHRRKGVTLAAERDVYVILVQADSVDSPAIALYETLGVKETAHHFDIAVLPVHKAL